jgi:anti-sigma-K factor RskA
MTTLNKEAPERQDLEALLPWHAAGTLVRRDSERLERALANDRDLARQYQVVREELTETIHLNEMLGAPSSRCMEKLFAAIEAESAKAPARRRSFDFAGRISEFMSGFSTRTLAWSASAAMIAIVAQGALLTTVAFRDQNGSTPELQSYRSIDDAQVVIRFVPQATVGDITKFLDAYKAVMVDGPNKGQLYSVRLPVSSTAAPETAKLVQRMQGESRIVEFIATK